MEIVIIFIKKRIERLIFLLLFVKIEAQKKTKYLT